MDVSHLAKTVTTGILLLAALSCSAQPSSDISPLDIYFKNNSATVSIKERKKIQRWLVKANHTDNLSIKGFADSVGSRGHNKKLAIWRAYAVSSIIQSITGNTSFSVSGYGEDSSGNNNPLWQNRRVSLSLSVISGKGSHNAETANKTNPKLSGSRRSFLGKRNSNLSDSSSANDGNKNGDTINNIKPNEPLHSRALLFKRADNLKERALQNILFEPDKPVLEEVSFAYLKDLAAALLQYPPTTSFEIIGHVHCWGKYCKTPGLIKINDKLSLDRARELYLHLQDLGISANRMTYRGVGSQNPLYPNAKTEEEARKNMRVEIVVHP